MALISEQIRETAGRVVDSLAAVEAGDAADSLPSVVARFDDDGLQTLLADASRVRSEMDAVIAAGAGVVAKRSERASGYSGLAQQAGHPNAAGFVQAITGSTKTEAWREVRLGEAMGEADAAARLAEAAGPILSGSNDSDVPAVPAVVVPWFAPITRAVSDHRITADGASALMRGLGEPDEHCGEDTLRVVAEHLVAGAAGVNADDLVKRARWARDDADPVGVTLRAEERFQSRKWRFGRKESGQRTAWVEFDDDGAAWVDSIVGAGMRPRRGGPRFVNPVEAERAQNLVEDPRSDEQVVYDLLMGVIRAGAVAEPEAVFGSRQPGIRVVITQEELDKKDTDGKLTGIGFLEDGGDTVPAAMVERLLCEVGTRDLTFDPAGNPLDVGREQRLFTVRQKIALAVRDGGCMACGQPASYTEAHHIQEWVADHGRTDIADGILLCRFDHMRVHNQGWKIRRQGSVYWMIPPPGIDPDQTPIRLHSKSRLTHKWDTTLRPAAGSDEPPGHAGGEQSASG